MLVTSQHEVLPLLGWFITQPANQSALLTSANEKILRIINDTHIGKLLVHDLSV